MKFEKLKKVDLKSKSGLSLNVAGFIVLVVIQFAFTNVEKVTKTRSHDSVITSRLNGEMVSITRNEEVTPQLTATIEILNIVIDKTTENDNLNVIGSKTTKDNKIEIAVIQIPTIVEQQAGEEVLAMAEIMPAFPGGDLALRKYIAKAIKYPISAVENGLQGRVFVKFVINKEGSVLDAKIARGVAPSLDKEAIRVIMSLPKWTPGMQQGKVVNVSLMFPISFQLQ